MTSRAQTASIIGSLEHADAIAGERPLLSFLDGPSYTAASLLDHAARMAGLLRGAGARPGDRVALLLSNRPEFAWAYFGSIYAGVVVAPLNTALRGIVLEHVFRETEPTVVVVERDTAEATAAALAVLGQQPVVLDVDDASTGPSAFHARFRAAEAAPGAPAADDELAMILYTSGTTGPSKGIIYTPGFATSFADSTDWMLGFTEEDIAYNCLPLFHGNSLLCSLLPALRAGAHSVFGARFSASTYWSEVRATKGTVVSLLGSMLPIIWNNPRTDRDRDHHVRIGLTVPSPTEQFAGFEDRFGFPLTTLYGMTDIGLVVGVPFGTPGRIGKSGIENPLFECRIVDEADRPLPDGAVGEMIVRPREPNIMQLGYWRQPEATVKSWRNLWFHTGDVLTRDADGWFTFVDRAKDAIRRFGENISSFEVEMVLQEHAAVAEVAVFAVPSDLAEDEVMAAVVVEAGAKPDIGDLVAHCEARLPYFAVPRYFRFLDELPKTPTAKVRKEALRSAGVDEETVDVGPRGKRARERSGP